MDALAELKQRLLARAAQRLAHDLNNDLTVIQAQTELAGRRPQHRLPERLDAIGKAAEQMRQRIRLIPALAQSSPHGGAPTSVPLALQELEQLAILIVGKQAQLKVAGDLTSGHYLDQGQVRLLAGALLLACLEPTSIDAGEPPEARLELVSRAGRPMLWFTLSGGPPPAQLARTLRALELDAPALERTASGYELNVPLTEREPPPASPATTATVAAVPGTESAPRLMVVDDETDVRYVLVQALKRQYQVVDAGSVRDAMERAEALPSLQMLITDARLDSPDDGLVLAAALRERWPGLPIIVVSGLPQDPGQTLPAGCLWLEKPVSLRTLRESVQQLLKATDSE